MSISAVAGLYVQALPLPWSRGLGYAFWGWMGDRRWKNPQRQSSNLDHFNFVCHSYFAFLYIHMLVLYCRHPNDCSCNCIIHYPQLSTISLQLRSYKCYLTMILLSLKSGLWYCQAATVRQSNLAARTKFNFRFVKLWLPLPSEGRQNLNSFPHFNELEISGYPREGEPFKGFHTQLKVALKITTHPLAALFQLCGRQELSTVLKLLPLFKNQKKLMEDFCSCSIT